jgi:uncharacterized damage-inducible protein DinB
MHWNHEEKIMQPFYESYLNNLLELHDEIRTAIQELPQEALDWTPGPGMNSINVLVVHLVGAERYWLGDVLLDDPSNRDRDSEFQVKGLSSDELTHRLADIEYYVQKTMAGLVLEDLDRKSISPRNGREVTVGYILPYVLKHVALHLGHIQITRQLWEQKS